ncbi:interleukin-4 receptor subunit alpha, partial [Clarias magur]
MSLEQITKPVKPINMSVTETPNGNFLIFWDTNYTTEEPSFSSELISELTYYVEGNNDSTKSVTLTEDQKKYELIGKKLESNSNYIVRVRVKHYRARFSDYSDPYRFTTPISLRDKLRIIIPILCVILIICIFISYYFYNKVLTDWWDKIPTPNIATNFVKQVPNLLSFQNEFSPVHLDPSKLVHAGEKI